MLAKSPVHIILVILLNLMFGSFGWAQSSDNNQEKEGPILRILEPQGKQFISVGKPLVIRWQVSNLPTHLKDWVVEVSLATGICDYGQATKIYTGQMKGQLQELHWTPNNTNELYWVDNPKYGGYPARVIVEIHQKKYEDDDLYAMWGACHAVLAESVGYPARAISDGTLTLVKK